MRIDIPIEDLPFGAVVLFDPEAMSELLSADPCPSRAVSRFPRRLDAEAARSNALVVRIGEYGMPALFVDEAPSPENLPLHAEEEESLTLRVPSGRILVTQGRHPQDPASRKQAPVLAEVPPGLYRVRVFRQEHGPGGEAVPAPGDLGSFRALALVLALAALVAVATLDLPRNVTMPIFLGLVVLLVVAERLLAAARRRAEQNPDRAPEPSSDEPDPCYYLSRSGPL